MGQLRQGIIDAMKASGQSRYAIAKGSGVSSSQLSRLVSGERGLTIATIEQLANYLRVRITFTPHARSRKAR